MPAAVAVWAEWALVLALVVASAVFALWRLLPATWRLRWQVRLGWRVAASACGCEACPTPKSIAAKPVLPPE